MAAVNAALDNKLADDSFGIDELASSMAMSRRSLQRKLKQYGITFSNLKNSHRITKAQEALVATAISVEDLAESLGFVNGHSFRQFFKKQTGMTVSEYRASRLADTAAGTHRAERPPHNVIQLSTPEKTAFRLQPDRRIKAVLLN